MIAAGRLRHRVSIERLVTELDTDGQRVDTWEPVTAGLVPAEIAPLSGRELLAAAAVQSSVNTRIVVRHRPGITAAMRVVHRGRPYNIEAVMEDPASGVGHLTLHCSHGPNEG